MEKKSFHSASEKDTENIDIFSIIGEKSPVEKSFFRRIADKLRMCIFPEESEKLSLSQELFGFFIIAVAYALVYQLGIYFTVWSNGLSALWPVSGFALAVFLLNPKERWLKLSLLIFLLSTLITWAGGFTPVSSLSFSLSGVFETVLCATVFTYFCHGKITFESTREIYSLFFVAIIVIAVTAAFDASLSLFFFSAAFVKSWLGEILTNGESIILITPFIVNWITVKNNGEKKSLLSKVEKIFIFILLVVFSGLLFGPFTIAENPLLRNYMLFPLLIFFALRFTPKEMISGLLLISIIAITGTIRGYGIFAFSQSSSEQNVFSVQIFIFVIVFSSLILSTIFKKLKEKDKLIDDYLSITLHELKTPLVPIKAQAQLLLAGEHGSLKPEQLNAVQMILRNEESLRLLASDVLDVTKIRSGKMLLSMQSVDLARIIENVVESYMVVFRQKDITLMVFHIPQLPMIKIDPQKIEQVLRNLLDNALKFTPEGGKVFVSVKRNAKYIIVSVQDNGIGLNLKNIEKISEPFFQVDSDLNRKIRGNGLGLSICKGLIEAHQGNMWISSEGEGKGTTVSFALPIK